MSSEVYEFLPVLREFVDAVNDRDPDAMRACFAFTPPSTLAVLCAGWVGELLDEAEASEVELARVREQLAAFPAGDIMTAWRVQKERTRWAEEKLEDSRELVTDLQRKLAASTRAGRAA